MVHFAPLLLVVAALAIGAGDARAANGEPLSVCLARHRIGIAVRTGTTHLDGSRRTGDGALSFSGTVQHALARLGAGIVAIEAPLGSDAGAAMLARPLNEAASRRATWLLALAIDAREYALSEYGMGAPWRTVAIGIEVNLVDVRSRVILASSSVPPRPFARRSTAEAMSELLADDGTFYEVLTQLLQQACAQRREQEVAISQPPPWNVPPPMDEQTIAPQPAALSGGEGGKKGEEARGETAHGTPGRHRAIVIGVADYQHLPPPGTVTPRPLVDLRYAADDARAFAQFLSNRKQAGDWEIQPLLLNDQATQRNINNQLQEVIGNAMKDDVIILFYSGHGRSDPANYHNTYLLPYDFDPDDPGSGISRQRLEALLSQSEALQIIAFIDACHSGVSVPGAKGGDGFAPERMSIEKKIGPMRTVFASSSGPENSQEVEDLGHGVFTYAVLKTLRTASGVLTLRDLQLSVEKEVAKTIRRFDLPPQTPRILFDYGGKFHTWPIARLGG